MKSRKKSPWHLGFHEPMSRYRKVVTAGVLAFSLMSSHGAAPLTGASTSTAPVVIDVTGDSISYQGRLTDSGSLASGSYDFQFLLKDAATGGSTVGEVLKTALPVQNGVFSASLSWSSSLFSGAARWIEVRVRPTPATGSATLDTVAPYAVLERQRILSTPYAFRSLTAATVESVPVQSLPASVPLIGSGGKLDSALLGTDIARSSEVDAKVASLAQKDAALQASVKTLEDANTARVADVATLTGNLKTAQDAQTASLNALSTQVDAKVASLTQKDGALQASVKTLEDANTARVADVATLTGSLKTAQDTQTASLNALSTQVDAKVASLAKEDVGLKGSIKVLEDANTARVADVATLTGNLKTSQDAQTASLNALSTQVDAKVASLAKEDVGLKGSIKALEDANTARVADVATLTGNLKTAQEAQTASLNALSTQLDAKVASLTQKDAALQASVKTLEDANTARVAENASLSANLKSLQDSTATSVNTLKGQISAQGEASAKENAAIQQSIQSLNGANAVRISDIAALTANLQNLQSKWTSSQEAMDAKLAALTAENVALKKSVQVIAAPARSGWMVASLQAEDSELVSAGFSLVSSTPAASWVPTASAGAPSARFASASVWTGQEWLIWGGAVASLTPVASGARYRPDTDSWSDLTSVDAPKARKGHTAVWTGSQMIVWGGFNENSLNTGGRFTPSTQSWSSMSTEGAPTARTGHGAVWTGKTMVIFGGKNSGGLLSDGGIYDPASDRWTALPSQGAPSPRHLASVIWTGKALLVWGGELADGDANSGALLSFDSAGKPLAWSTLPVLEGFAGRSGHASVWEGQRFIVWGGRHRSGALLADGALWDSTTSKWTYLDAAGAPPARFDASAVWAGDELVVFGGSGSQGTLASGAAWSLSTRKWRTLPSQSSTGARNGALAAWTGSHLLIFGGLSSGGIALADPQRIDIRPPGISTAAEPFPPNLCRYPPHDSCFPNVRPARPCPRLDPTALDLAGGCAVDHPDQSAQRRLECRVFACGCQLRRHLGRDGFGDLHR